jgi:hypothetical protein
LTVDPVSGAYLVFGADGSFYVYDVAADTWTKQSQTNLFAPVLCDGTCDARFVWQVVATPVSTYGVVAFVKFNFGNSTVYIYKHASQ